MMKKLLLMILIALTSYSYSYSQILAGHLLDESTNIFPDTLINCYNTYPSIITESFLIDINQDSEKDFEIKAYCQSGHVSSTGYIAIISLSPDLYSRFDYIDSAYNVYGEYWMTAPVAKAFYYGDTINTTDAQWRNGNLYMRYSHSNTGSYLSFNAFSDTVDRYIGVKYKTDTDSAFGWIRVRCGSGCLIKDYSFQSSALSINTLNSTHFTLYPNPASTTLTIQSTVNSPQTTVTIYNTQGQQVYQSLNHPITKSQIDISQFPSGLYYLHLQSEEGVAVKKFEVIH
ncbi:MAG: T9SS type A sorting domain-containing protein [Bacteroidia bacterium]